MFMPAPPSAITIVFGASARRTALMYAARARLSVRCAAGVSVGMVLERTRIYIARDMNIAIAQNQNTL